MEGEGTLASFPVQTYLTHPLPGHPKPTAEETLLIRFIGSV